MSDKEPKQYANHVIPNSFQTPNIYVDLLLELLTDSELRILLFATRHILGWREKIKMRKGIISLEMFVNGYGPYPGCGLNKQTVIKTCKSLVSYKVLEKDGVTRDGTRWHLVENFDDIEIGQLETRLASKKSKDKKRTENMLEKLKAKRLKLLSHNTGDVLSHNTGDVLSHNTESNPLSNLLSNKKDLSPPNEGDDVVADSKTASKCVLCHKRNVITGTAVCQFCLDNMQDIFDNRYGWRTEQPACPSCNDCHERAVMKVGDTVVTSPICHDCYFHAKEQSQKGDDVAPVTCDEWTRHTWDNKNGMLLCNNPDCLDYIDGDYYSTDEIGSALCVSCWLKGKYPLLDMSPELTHEEIQHAAELQRWQDVQNDNTTVGCLKCDGRCEVNDVDDFTECDTCKTKFDIQRNCSLSDHGYKCEECEPMLSDDCAIKDGHVYLFEQKPTVSDLSAPPQLTVEELDNTILGTRDKPVQPTEHIGALCEVVESTPTPLVDQAKAMQAIAEKMSPKAKKPRKAKPKQTPEQKQTKDNIWEAVKSTWKLDDNAAWKIAKLQQFFMGTIKKTGKYKDFFHVQLEIPSNAMEVVAFGHWYRTEYDNASMPESAPKLRSHFETFRGSGDRYQSFMRKAQRTIAEKIPSIKLPGVVEKQPEPGEDELIEMTPERIAEMKALMDSIGKGGVK